MSIVGLYTVPLTESRKVHLIVMLNNGIRIYLRLIGTDRCPTGNGSYKTVKGIIIPVGVEIVYIRNPPSSNLVRASVPGAGGTGAGSDFGGMGTGSDMEGKGDRDGDVPIYSSLQSLEIQTG